MERRKTCIICKQKRYVRYMVKVIANSWACKDKECCEHNDIKVLKQVLKLEEKLTKLTFRYIHTR